MAEKKETTEEIDYTLNNPDTLTKYKSAATISQKVLEEVTKLCTAGEKIVTVCERGDKLLEDEISKVYRGKKIAKGISHPTTVSPSSFVTPYTPLTSDDAEAAVTLKEGEAIKIQLGAQIDGFGAIVCDTILVPSSDNAKGEIHGRDADLLLATYYANEVLLRLMVPPGLFATGTDEEKAKAAKIKAPTQAKITSILEKVAKSYGCNLVEHTTSWQFERNEIEGKKKIILSPGDGTKGDGIPEVGEVWGVEVGISLGSGKTKNLENRPTLHRRTTLTYALKRPSSKKILNEVVKKFGTFPFSLRQLEDERDAKMGVVECVRGNVFRQYEVVGDKDGSAVGRLLTTIAITKNGLQKLAAAPAPDLSKFKTDNKITDEEVLKILEQPLAKESKSKNKKKKNCPGIAVAIEEKGARSPQATMSNLNTRPTRSRISSPFVSAPTNSNASASKATDSGGRTKTFLDKWIEPPLPTPQPSFADAGLMRHSVVANMAPLGTRPSLKIIKAAAKPESLDGGRRSAVTRRAAAASSSTTPTPRELVVTPEPVPSPVRPGSAPAKGDSEDQPKTPPQQTSPRKSVSRSGNSGQIGQGVFQIQHSPIIDTPRSERPLDADGEMEVDMEQTDKVVEAAVQEALDNRRWPTAYALRTWYDENRDNIRAVRLIEAIYDQRATSAQQKEFIAAIKTKKREGKEGKTGEYYFNGDGSDPPPRPAHISLLPPLSQSPFAALNAQYTPVFHNPFTTPINPPVYRTPYAPTPQSMGAGPTGDSQARRSPNPYSSVPASPQKEQHDASHHVSKKLKPNHFPQSSEEVDGIASPGAKASASTTNGQGKQNGTTAKKTSPRRVRAKSESSASSLSSVDEEIFGGDFNHHDGDDHNNNNHNGAGGSDALTPAEAMEAPNVLANSKPSPGTNSGDAAHMEASVSANASSSSPDKSLSNSHSHSHSRSHSRSHSQVAQNKLGPKTYIFSTTPNTATSKSPSNIETSAEHDTSETGSKSPMAAVAVDPLPSTVLFPSLSSQKHIIFKPKKDYSKIVGPGYDENDSSSRMRRKAKEVTDKSGPVHDSFERHQVPLLPEPESASDGGDSIAATKIKRRTKVRLLHHQGNKRFNYDSDLSSPTLPSYQTDLAPGSLSTSRAGTPNTFGRPSRRAKTGTGLRVKTSPMKKKGGTAGIPRASGERNSPIGNGASQNQDDNDDYCSSCGGNGDLVCCDGCTRSFHFKCVDPPMIEGSLPDEWFCNLCLASRLPRLKDEDGGTFGYLLAQLERKNPSAFHLPKSIREYFVDVKTGAEGEYEEGLAQKPKNRAGYDETPDYFKLKDSKGNPILCHLCHGSASQPDRMIIPCGYCGLSWHLDCLDPPMAKEPPTGKAWRCPAHVDDLLSQIPGNLGPAHRFRRIKGASVIKPAVSRGIRNNGHIEIENTPTDDEEEQGFFEHREYGQVYKLPEEGIKLDFISAVRRKTGGRYTPSYIKNCTESTPPVPWNARSLEEQQCALNMSYLASHAPEDGTQQLIDALISEAPPAAISLIAQGDASSIASSTITKKDKSSLLALKALIDKQLASLQSDEPQPETRNHNQEEDDTEMLL
ncbi:hypothetical protein B7494_g7865 [Chlorociboria aeruginascens]|nr:hypothetical protein B7494_g7865 [Chlorociboria aeruginascens]